MIKSFGTMFKNSSTKGKNAYVDYAKSSEYFVDDNQTLKEEIESVEKSKKFVTWIQEFSKKIVTGIFAMYIVITLVTVYFMYLSFIQGSIVGIETMYSEISATFRDVVGGYLVKAGIENAVKIGGNYYIGIADARLRAMRNKLAKDEKITQMDAEAYDMGNKDYSV